MDIVNLLVALGVAVIVLTFSVGAFGVGGAYIYFCARDEMLADMKHQILHAGSIEKALTYIEVQRGEMKRGQALLKKAGAALLSIAGK